MPQSSEPPPDPAGLNVHSLLADARQRLGVTQNELASRLGKPQSFISKYESGDRRLTVAELIRIAAALDLDPAAIVADLIPQVRRADTILDEWEVTAEELTVVLRENPSLKGMVFGYVAELKLKEAIMRLDDVTYQTKFDDHDRKKKGDLFIIYRGAAFHIESKSLQTKDGPARREDRSLERQGSGRRERPPIGDVGGRRSGRKRPC